MLLVVVAVYIPPVQDAVFKKVVSTLNSGSGGLHVDYKSLRLKFPAHVVADSVSVTLPGDIEAHVGYLNVPVNVLPLFALDISSNDIDIEDVRFRLGSPDSTLYLRAAVDTLAVEHLSVGLHSMHIDVKKGDVCGVDVTLLIAEDTVPKVDTAKVAGKQFVINAGQLALHRVNYMMSITPTIDTIAAQIASVDLKKGIVDLNTHQISAVDFDVEGVEAKYIYSIIPAADKIREDKPKQEEATDSVPWQISVDNIELTGSRALYALNGAQPLPGLDLNYIEARDIDIKVDSFYNCRQDICVPLKKFRATERCGLELRASGTFSIDSSLMRARDFIFELPGSTLNLDALMGLQSERYPVQSDCPVKVDLSADVAPADVSVLLPNLAPILHALPRATPILASVDASGTMDNIDIRRFSVELPRLLRLSIGGYAAGFMGDGLKDLTANLRLQGDLMNTQLIKPTVVEAKLGKGVKIIPFTISGQTKFYRGHGNALLAVKAADGSVALDGDVNFNNEAFDVELTAHDFPVQSFMPEIGIADLSASVSAKGKPFDPLKQGATLNADVVVDSVYYHKVLFHSLRVKADIAENDATLIATADMPEADFTLLGNGNVNGPDYAWRLNADVKRLELQPLGFSGTANGGTMRMKGQIDVNTDSLFVNSHFDFPLIDWTLDERNITTKALEISFDADRNGTVFDLTDRDLLLEVSSPQSLDSILRQIPTLKEAIDSCMRIPALKVDYVLSALPRFDVELVAKRKNVIAEWMAARGDYFDSLGVSIVNRNRLSVSAMFKDYKTPSYIIDSLCFDMRQRHDSLDFRAHLYNSPMSPGDWANVKLWGRLGGNELVARFWQKNHDNVTGFRFGLDAQYADSTLTVSFEPVNPIINYNQWNLNAENFISLNIPSRHLDANLTLSHGNSLFRLYTDHIEDSDEQEEINLVVKDIEISDWISLNPFATPMKGLLSGRLTLSHEGKVFTGDGKISLSNYYYGKQLVGNFDLGVDVSTTPGGFIHASADLDVNSRRVLDVYGVLNDTTAANPFFLKVDIDSFPLPVANPFLADAGVSLTGNLSGNMLVTGQPSSPVFNGSINFINTGVKVGLLGTTYHLSNNPIPVDTGIVRFNRYTITGVNNNPLYIDGTVNMHDVLNPRFNLAFNANDMQIIGTDRARGGAELYGKGFVNLDATVRGSMKFMNVKANAELLNTTNVTYVLVGGAESALASRSNSSLVKFVNFSDSSMVSAADSLKPTGMLMNISALLKIDRGATISVDLSTDGKNKVQLQPVGNLDYTRDVLGAQHLTGRIDIDGGFARYTPPLMSEKLFNFQEGSYVGFNGDIANPQLNIKAVDHVRANVTQEGANSRLINFDVGLSVTGSLSNMDVAFDLSTSDDVTVENELESMSPSQRASKAMNLLLTNTYTGPGTSADANMGANALYSFLSSTLNSWAANNIKAVDLSFGVNQYENTTDGVSSQATSYSYKVSKSLFNDRFKINVGGNYTTDADADENLTQNLISDISIEYMLNKNGSMYIKIFRHAGYESILEGEVIQTGVGFTYRRRLDSLRQMFWFLLPKQYRYGYRQQQPVSELLHPQEPEIKK